MWCKGTIALLYMHGALDQTMIVIFFFFSLLLCSFEVKCNTLMAMLVSFGLSFEYVLTSIEVLAEMHKPHKRKICHKAA